MKTLILLMILFPTIAFCQENLNKSAEDFIIGYFKLFDEKKWEEIPKAYSEDSKMISSNYAFIPMTSWKNFVLTRLSAEITSDKIDVKWMTSDIIGTSNAMVTTNFTETTDRSGTIKVTDHLAVFLLEQKEGLWKIKKWINQQNNPLIFDQNIDKNYQTGRMTPIQKFESALGQINALFAYEIEYAKKNGTSPAELGKRMGTDFAKSWDQTKGFPALASSFITGCQVFGTYAEVLERNDNKLKIKLLPYSSTHSTDVAKEEMLTLFRGVWSEIADHMGGKCTLVEDGKYWILTMDKK